MTLANYNEWDRAYNNMAGFVVEQGIDIRDSHYAAVGHISPAWQAKVEAQVDAQIPEDQFLKTMKLHALGYNADSSLDPDEENLPKVSQTVGAVAIEATPTADSSAAELPAPRKSARIRGTKVGFVLLQGERVAVAAGAAPAPRRRLRRPSQA